MKLSRRGLLFLTSTILVLMLMFSSLAVFAEDIGVWKTKASMSMERDGFETAVVNGKIYVMGGLYGGNYSNAVEEYNPKTDTWKTVASMNIPRHKFGIAVVNGKIYAIGGGVLYTNGILQGQTVGSIEEYNPDENKWVIKTSMNIPRTSCAVEVVNNKIYILGGDYTEAAYRTIEEYDPLTNICAQKATMDIKTFRDQTIVVDGKIYAMGSITEDNTLCSVVEYDPFTDTCITKAALPTPRISFEVVVENGKIYAVGGNNKNGFEKIVEQYDPVKNIWLNKEHMLHVRTDYNLAVIDGRIYSVSVGYDNDEAVNSVEEYNIETNTWREVAPMLNMIFFNNVAVVNGKIYTIGGTNLNGESTKTLEEFTPPTYIPSATRLTATKDKSKVNLSWEAVSEATGYNIKRATTSTGPYTTIATSASVTYTDTSTVAGNTYYYIVTATNENVEGVASNEVVVTIPTPSVSIEVASLSKAKLNDEITASIIIHDAKNICAEDIQLAYDKDKLELISAEGADGIKIYKESTLSEGIIRYITASLGKSNAANGDKILINLKFKAKALGGAKIDITGGRIADNSTLEEDILEDNCGEKTIFIEPLVPDVVKPESNTLLALGIASWYYGDTTSNADTSKYNVDINSNGLIDDDDLSEIVTKILSNASYSSRS